MKKLISITAILLLLPCFLAAQNKIYKQKAVDDNLVTENNGSYPVDARVYLDKFNKVNGINEEKIAQESAAQAKVMQKITNPVTYSVGSTKTWWASNLDSETSSQIPFYQTPSTCRAVGTHCYVFVEDSLWTNGRVTQSVVDSVRTAFDSKTPANSSKGIYDTDVETFGNPPNVDGDSKIIIFILNIKDGFSGSGAYVAGYFYSINESLTYTNSNRAEIYYLDANPLNLKTANGIKTGMSTTAHEFQHMINWNYLPSSETFFNEGWSLVAEVICGYSLYSQSYFAGEANHYLLDWRSDDGSKVLNDYSRAAKFALYLKEQFGVSIFKNYLSNRVSGVSGLSTCITALNPKRNFSSVLVDWWVANFINTNVNSSHPEWAYSYSPITKVSSSVSYADPNITNGSTSGVYKYSAEYVTFTSGKNLSINFNTSVNSNIKIKAIKVGANATVVEDVIAGEDYLVSDFGTTYPSVTFMVYNNNYYDGTGPFVYKYTSTGTSVKTVKEIAYDISEPTFVYGWSAGDTMSVRFDGISGMMLDSIRIALRNTKPIDGGIWRTQSSSLYLGKKLAAFTLTGKSAPSTYPVPWNNWVSYDLRSLNIDASSSFAIAIPVLGKYVSYTGSLNNVMVTSYKSSSAYHSYTYLISTDASSGTAKWYYITDTDSTVALYLMRAYVSNRTTGVNETIELLPSAFALSQNYPNPFNPSTVIRYALPKETSVQIKIFNSLGQEVRTLINNIEAAGTHNLLWDSRDNFGRIVSSGIYFYTIKAGNFVETKKMVLMK